MRRWLGMATGLGLAAAAVAARAGDADAGVWFVRVPYTTRAQVDDLARRAGHVIVDTKSHEVAFDVDTAGLDQLRAAGYAPRVEANRTQDLRNALGARRAGIPNFTCYRTVEETYAAQDALVAQHPTLASIVEIGDSWERTQNAANGYRLRVLKLTNAATNDAQHPKPKLFAMFAVHAREYTTAEFGMRAAEWLANNYGKDPQATWLLDRNELHLLIQANPDGRKRAEAGVLWRKNTDPVNGLCGTPSQFNQEGIDVNRNFPFNWNVTSGNGSSPDPCAETYHGPSSASEPETQAIVRYVAGTQSGGVYSGGIFADQRVDDRLTQAPATIDNLFLDYHSYAQLVLWPWGDGPADAPDVVPLRTLGRRMAYYTNYTPEASYDLYQSDGTTIDTVYGSLGVPAYTIEMGIDFFETCDAFETQTFPRNLGGFLYAARSLHAPLQLPSGPDAADFALATDLVAPGDAVLVRATLDDTRARGGEPTQAIAGGTATIDALPWDAAAAPISFVAADGVFSSNREDAYTVLPTADLPYGRHLVFAQARDAGGAKGPPSAAFLEVGAPATIGMLTGYVRSGEDAAPLLATVRATGASDTHATSTAANDGAYARSVHAGTVHAEASAPGYMTERATAIVPGAGSAAQDFSLLPLCQRFIDFVESGNAGWQPQAPWGIVANISGNGTHVWTDSPAGVYANNADTSLVSPAFNFRGMNEVRLEFDDRCVTEPDYDFGHVEISTDAGASWTELYRCSGRSAWQHQAVALPQATDRSGVRVRFRLTSDGGLGAEGWSIDNIRIAAGGTGCRASYGDVIFQDRFDPL